MTNDEVRTVRQGPLRPMTNQARMKVRRAVPRAGMLAVAAVLVLSATAFTSCGQSTTARGKLSQDGSVSYPATYAVPLDNTSVLTRKMDTALTRIVLGCVNDPGWADDNPQRRNLQRFLAGRREWARVSLPQRVSDVVAGAEVYLAKGDGNTRYMVAERGGHVYMLPRQMNKLMSDCGVAFRNEDVPEWTPVVIYFAAATARFHLYSSAQPVATDQPGPPADLVVQGSEPLVPPLVVQDIRTTLSVRDQSLNPGIAGAGYVARVSASYTMTGETRRVDIWTRGGDRAGGRVYPSTLSGTSLDLDDLEAPAVGASRPSRMTPSWRSSLTCRNHRPLSLLKTSGRRIRNWRKGESARMRREGQCC